ncbi:MAG: hypothetical protein ACPG5P_05980, partial [Saprospiraceae bacterium]
LSDENGITNRFTGKLEEYIAYYEKIILLKSGEEMIIPRDSVPDLETFPEIDSVFVRAIKKQRGDNFSSTSYPRNIKETNYSLRSGKMMETIAYQDGVRLYVSDIDPLQRKGLLNTPYRQQLVKQKVKEEKIEKEIKEKKEEPEEKPSTWEFESTYEEDKTEDIVEIQDTIPADTIPENKVVEEEIGFEFVTDYIEAKTTEPETPIEDEGIIDLDNYEFEGDFDTDVPDAAVIVENEDGRITLQSPSINFAKDNYLINDKKVHKFRTSKIRPHRLRFRSNSITTQVDNSLLFGGWEPYTGEVFNQPPLSILVKSSVEDLFEDYELEAGFRIPTTFNGLEYFATFKDKKKRIDKYYSYYRQSKKNTYEANQLIPTSTPGLPAPVVSPPGVVYNMKTVTNLVQTELRYPLDIFGSIRATASFRNDKRQFLSNDDATLDAIPEQTQRLGVKVEYVYDNTIEVDLNILNGTRMKVY